MLPSGHFGRRRLHHTAGDPSVMESPGMFPFEMLRYSRNGFPESRFPAASGRWLMGIFLTGIFCFFLCAGACAQSVSSQSWLFLSHQQKLGERYRLLADIQTRSEDFLARFQTLLLRSGLSYSITKTHSIAIGYAYKADWELDEAEPSFAHENRVFEQYLYERPLRRTELTFRCRLEQRWVSAPETRFSQRIRFFAGLQIPLSANADFSRGLYTGLQNEIFLNVTNRDAVNANLFDQNRSFGSIGYRWSKMVDTEIGYQFWHQKEADGISNRHVFQLQVSTGF
ncbi:DUF2490 domain-containing protein [Pedobacter sp. SYP-B3415]|uniref:DUF2490 domain-containing protein n=1 Tax=Pedobacter sp. SYP-B3415 TaxID=2496641 RepID=UPI00101DA338|nr:DUF2490 domain-containing protein [Pedobacter sp. SYP-B3415]